MARNLPAHITDRDGDIAEDDDALDAEGDRDDDHDDEGDSFVKETVKGAVIDKAADAAAAKGIPVKGLEEIAARPTSIKAWATTGVRTGVTMALSSVTGVFGGYIEEIIHKIGYKRILWGLGATAVFTAFITFVMAATLVASVTEAVVKPVTVIGSLMDFVPGYGPDDDQLKGIPDRVCPVPPKPRAGQTVYVETQTPTEDGGVETTTVAQESNGGFIPEPAIGEDGKVTDEARALMRNPGITRNVDPLRVETWMLYALSHPKDDPKAQWDEFGTQYRMAYNFVARQKGEPELSDEPAQNSNRSVNVEPQGLKPVRTDITPMEMVMQIDPTAYYEPFRLAAATMTATLALEEDRLNQTDDQLSAVIGRMQALCGM